MGPLIWTFDLGECRACAIAEHGMYLVQGRADQTWVAVLIRDSANMTWRKATAFPMETWGSLADAMRACRNHAEGPSRWSGRLQALVN